MISIEFENKSSRSLYVQLYDYLKREISEGRIKTGERLPSLRSLAGNLGVSVTTVKIAYDQLITEGYLISKPQSGFYAAQGAEGNGSGSTSGNTEEEFSERFEEKAMIRARESTILHDPESFDFVKWKKCMATVLNDTPELLLTDADKQGEPYLRSQIASYLYKSRGVICNEDQIVISAGTQILTGYLARILRLMDIVHVSVEDPGYTPVRNIFRDWGFSMSRIPVVDNGIQIEKLPVNIRTAVYVCPQNQFPTGALMPIARRRELLNWADANDSIIIEDDYNSELRYTGMPVPALQGLDDNGRVIYIGSFTSTLFPSVRISYMVLPPEMIKIYEGIKVNYDQSCSKTEQLTLARFMESGYYHVNLRRIKKLYSRKLKETLDIIKQYGERGHFLTAENTQSGINLIMKCDVYYRELSNCKDGGAKTEEIRGKMAAQFIQCAEANGIKVRDIEQLDYGAKIYLSLYYSQIPFDKIKEAVSSMIRGFVDIVRPGCVEEASVREEILLSGGEAELLSDHYDRLSEALTAIGVQIPFSEEELRNRINELRDESGVTDHVIMIEADASGYISMHLVPEYCPDSE